MQCVARWFEEDESGLCYRDQTILQFGNSWNLIANYILLNPGSACPVDKTSQNQFLQSMDLPFFVKSGGQYRKFSIDRLMHDLLELYQSHYSGGVIKIYNLFNLKNQDSESAIDQYKKNKSKLHIHTEIDEINYGNAPVVIATGRNVYADEDLVSQLEKYISLAHENRLFAIKKTGSKLFQISTAQKNRNGLIDSYHPSYTFKYGNQTQLEKNGSSVFPGVNNNM